MSKKKKNREDRGQSSEPLSAREILSGAGRKTGKSRIEKFRKKTSKDDNKQKSKDGWEQKGYVRKQEDEKSSGDGAAQKSRPEGKQRRPSRVSREFKSEKFDSSREKKEYRNKTDRKAGGGKSRKNVKRRSPSSNLNSQSVAQKDYLRDEIRLNKFIAHAGLCSRREADEYIEQGKVRVNGKVITELGSKVKSSDQVEVDRQKMSLEPFVYILLNKGKDTISTTDDEKDRNTVVDAIEGATGHRVYPVGRLDRNTMGLLILTNDGDLAHRLMHPSYKVKKTYEVNTSRLLTDDELNELRAGITLEDGPVNPAGVKRDPMNPYVTTISVFEGRNHLIRRIVGYFGADVAKLVRTRYAGLTDKDLRIGRWRYLKQKEINNLRQLVKLDTLAFNKIKI